MKIYDGNSNTSPMLGKYCGESIPPNHISSSNEFLIHFESDAYGTELGFKIEYHQSSKDNHMQKSMKASTI